MNVEDISAADMTALKEQGYTERDLELLNENEVKDLLIVIPTDEDSKADPHETALQEQDEAAAKPVAEATPAEKQAEGADETPADEVVEAEPPAQETPAKPAMPQEIVDQISTLKAEEKEAFKKLMDAEIDADAYQAIKDRVENAVYELREQAADARRVMENAQREWKAAETAQMASAKAEGVDYMGKPALLAAFNTHLRALGSDEKNAKRDAAWFLSEAHKLTKADLGFVAKAPAPPKKPASGVDIGELPPTLRAAPVAATGAVNTDEFAHMRNLEGIALEKAHAALTEAQRDRWMNS